MENEEKIKFSAFVPIVLYLNFSQIAREQKMKEYKQTRGAITEAIGEAMRLYIKEYGGGQ